MTERYVDQHQQPTPERLTLPANMSLWTSLEQMRRSGLSEPNIHLLAEQVAASVNEYNSGNPSEMLRKTPEVVLEQLADGRTCLIAAENNHEWQFAYHGSLYPVFEQGEERVTGTQIIELGTDITHADYRNQGLGQLGLQTRLGMLNRWREPGVSVLGLATVKRLVTGYVYGKMHVTPVSYWDHPYLAYLTDTCENSSERFGHESCEYRRTPENSDRQSLHDLFREIGGNAYIPCTVVVTDPGLARTFDDRMRDNHQSWLGQSVPVGEISTTAYQSIDRYYEEVQRRTNQR